MKKILLSLFVSLQLLGCTSPPAEPPAVESEEVVVGAQQADVQLEKEVFSPGETIRIVALGTGLSDQARVAVRPAGPEAVGQDGSLDAQRLKEGAQPALTAPTEPGEYEVTLHDGETELATRRFVVERPER